MASWVRRVGGGGRWALWVLAAALVAACGGGGGGSGNGGGDGEPGGGGAPVGVGPIATEPGNQALPRIEPYERTSAMALERRLAPSSTTAVATPSGVTTAVNLGPLTANELAARDAALTSSAKARPIGQGRAVPALADPAAFASALAWQDSAGGGRLGSVRVHSPGAAGLRLGLWVGQLPTGTTLRVQGSSGAAVTVGAAQVLQTLARNAAGPGGGGAARMFWLPPVAGEAVTLSIELPASGGTEAAPLVLAVPQVSHLWWTHAAVRDAAGLKVGEADSCNLDAACSPEYAFESRSVARLEFIDNGNAFLCSGTLLADTTASGAPWFLTARHCIGNQATASTIATFWFYRATACNSNTLDPAATQRGGGATLLYTSDATDSAFLRLEQSPPVGAVHAGAMLGPPAVGSALVSLHHPGGDLLKLSVGRTLSYAQCNGTTCSLEPDNGADYLAVGWNTGGGTTESGSSGSAVFAAVGTRRYVVGHLFAGSASCTSPQLHDFYGRLDKDYPSLRQYLGSVPGT